jgi:dTDP-4-amino-4,6-dideoxygalactose transaminase
MTVPANPVPFLDLKAQYASIGAEIEDAVCAVLRSGQYSLGAPVRDFEDAFAAYCGTRHAVGVNSGT